jgi:hypothetical protein
MTEEDQPLGIMLLHLISGKDVVADVSLVKEQFYCCDNPLAIEIGDYEGMEASALYFTPLLPMFTGESVVIPEDKVVYMIPPNKILIKVYQEYVKDIIQKNQATLAQLDKKIDLRNDYMKKNLH